MFSQLKTSKVNKDNVTMLTKKFGLGAENIIARIALAYSLESRHHFEPSDVRDSGGKEYSKKILFGNYYDIYEAMLCTLYNLKSSDKDIPKFFKIHLDDGLEMIAKDVKDNPNLIGFDYLTDKIKKGLEDMK
ncbi:MAG: DndE family protein [Prevotella sp.]|jgi:DNA sulfur modification protein DndE|nr:DndE family protein [Prevotella sp.]MCH3993818.1 DndE family protein [Prevotella sp.]